MSGHTPRGSDEAAPSRRHTRPILFWATAGGCLAAASLEWAMVVADASANATSWLTGPILLGLWSLVAALLASTEYLLGRAVFGPDGVASCLERKCRLVAAYWSRRFTVSDSLAAANLLSWIVALVVLVGLTLCFAAWLERNAHGVFLIVCAVTAAQGLFFIAAIVARRVVLRQLLRLIASPAGQSPTGRRIVSIWSISGFLLILAVATGLYVVVRHGRLMADTDVLSLGLPLLAVCCQPLLVFHFWLRQHGRGPSEASPHDEVDIERRSNETSVKQCWLPPWFHRLLRPRHRRRLRPLPIPRPRHRLRPLPIPVAILAMALVGLFLVWAGSLSASARASVSSHSWTGKYLLHLLESISDVDTDGSPAFPRLMDCRPFDGSVHPLAKEIPGNDIDENCDGSDSDIRIGPDNQEWRNAALPPERHSQSSEPLPYRQPDLILVTVDALRADHLGFMGYQRNTSPDLDRLAHEGLVFEAAFSQDSGTGPSFWSLMAGKTPFQTRLAPSKHFPLSLADDETALGELLQAQGYTTVARVCGSMFAGKKWKISRGFSDYKEVCGKTKDDLAPVVTAKALGTLRELRRKKEPFFLWIHYFDPHEPYQEHPDYSFGSEEMDRYDSEIRFANDSLADLLDKVRAPNARPCYLFLGADHGENFEEHGTSRHARTLYREVTHVPMVVWGPGVEPRREGTPVALNDLHPTMLELAGTLNPESTMVSLVPYFHGPTPDLARVIFQENSFSRPRQHVKAAIHGQFHLIMNLSAGTQELFNWCEDPGESSDLSGQGLEIESAMSAALQDLLQTSEIPKQLR